MGIFFFSNMFVSISPFDKTEPINLIKITLGYMTSSPLAPKNSNLGYLDKVYNDTG